MDNLAQLKAAAAHWIAKRAGDDWNDADQAALEQWLDASTGNRIAFLRMEAMWRKADRLRVLDTRAKAGTVPSLEDWRASPFFKLLPREEDARLNSGDRSDSEGHGSRPWVSRLAVAAGFAIIAVGSGLWGWMSLRLGASYSTPIGVTAAVPLSDGSKVTLNTASEIRVAVTEKARQVHLEQGEAFFDVARDPSRPFTVIAGEKRVIAVGTRFSVRRDGDDVKVIVTEGKVRVESSKASLTSGRDDSESTAGAEGVLLTAGHVADAHDDRIAVSSRPLPQAEELLSWRAGYVVFHETALTDAVAEFNRYNTRKFVIHDPALAGILVSGNFRATNMESFAHLLEEGFPVIVERQGERIMLARRAR